MLIDDLLYVLRQIGDESNLDEGLAMALRFQVDNVAYYAYSDQGWLGDYKHYKDVSKNLPNIAPLAPVMWFEFGGLAKAKNKPATNRYGCLLSVDYCRRESQQKDGRDTWYESQITDDTYWVLRSQCFANLSHALVNMRLVHYVSVAEDGRFIEFLAREYAFPHSNPTESKEDEAYFYNEALVALLSICFAHCKGAEIEEHQPTRQVRRAAERAGNPVFTFHTIDIHPGRQVLHSEGHISENGLAKALHICRGHFAHYTSDKPLFGKYIGTFYRPMHVRGSAEKGIVAKDYRVLSE